MLSINQNGGRDLGKTVAVGQCFFSWHEQLIGQPTQNFGQLPCFSFFLELFKLATKIFLVLSCTYNHLNTLREDIIFYQTLFF
jgi:hypothetical protein